MKPILFSTPMIQAILAGRKSMTRRVVKAPVLLGVRPPDKITQIDDGFKFWWNGTGVAGSFIIKPRYQVGDVLWVRETWCDIWDDNAWWTKYGYKADGEPETEYWGEFKGSPTKQFRWRPSIYMPFEAARVFLKITAVRCERLQDITPHDAWHEGCRIGNSFSWEDHIPELQQQCRDLVFVSLWDSINGKKYPWSSDPFCWVYTFERCEKAGE